MKIPKIIHQIWSGVDEPLPSHFSELGNTWKRDYPNWQYIQWDNTMMNDFIQQYYPQYLSVYNQYPYNVQRWDAIRYLILDKIGGMYVDYDYESIKQIDELIKNKECCFALEPQPHCFMFSKRVMFNNALMLSIPGHPFMKKIVEKVFSSEMLDYGKDEHYEAADIRKHFCVMNTTGPWILIDLYQSLSPKEKENVFLIPAKYVTPFDGYQAKLFRSGDMGEDLEEALEEAYAVHYFFSNWRKEDL